MVRSRILSVILLAFAAVWAGCVRPAFHSRAGRPSADCGKGSGFEYCVYHAPGAQPSDPDTHLYFLHGGGGSASSWGQWEVARRYYEDFRRRGVPAPTVVGVSFGKIWLLTELGAGKASGLLDRFVRDAIPAVESRIGKPRRRILWGLSMGGFNGSQLVLKHSGLWNAAALSCPAISTLPPSAGPADIDAYVRRTGAELGKARWMAETASAYFTTPDEWDRHAPIALAARATALPPILVQCGDRDEYGFFEGAEAFVRALESAGRPVRFSPIPGGVHCAVADEEVFSFFASELQEAGAPS